MLFSHTLTHSYTHINTHTSLIHLFIIHSSNSYSIPFYRIATNGDTDADIMDGDEAQPLLFCTDSDGSEDVCFSSNNNELNCQSSNVENGNAGNANGHVVISQHWLQHCVIKAFGVRQKLASLLPHMLSCLLAETGKRLGISVIFLQHIHFTVLNDDEYTKKAWISQEQNYYYKDTLKVHVHMSRRDSMSKEFGRF